MVPAQSEFDSGAGELPTRRFLAALGMVLAVCVLWRVPSFFDPPWVNDEGTYYAIAQGMAHGMLLYTRIWENKPPGIYLLFAAAYHLFGPSVVAVRVLATVAILFSVALAAALGAYFRGRPTAIVAALVAGLLFGVPFLEGTTANAETIAAPLVAAAVYLGFLRQRWEVAGLLIGCAILLKSVEAFDGVAIGISLLVHRRGAVPRYVLPIAGVLACCLAVAWAAGDVRALVRDAFLYDVGYVNHANGGGLPWLLLLKLAVLAAGTIWLLRGPFPRLWLLYAIAGALFSGRIFGHYFLQAVIPFAIVVVPTIEAGRVKRAGTAIVGTLAFGVLAITAFGALLQRSQGNSILASRLQYYGNFAQLAVGAISYPTYRGRVDDHVNRNLAVVRRLRALPGGPLLVWGNCPWIYPLSGRLPATLYTSSLRSPEVPGETNALIRAVVARRPEVLVVMQPPLPALGAAGRELSRYRHVGQVGDAAIYAR